MDPGEPLPNFAKNFQSWQGVQSNRALLYIQKKGGEIYKKY